MIKTIKLLKGSWFGPLLISVLCVSVLILGIPVKAPATALEYAVMLALISILIPDVQVSNKPWAGAWGVVSSQLQMAANGAADANTQGDQIMEISRLSKAIGAAEALMGMTSSCDDCQELRSDLQQIIGLASFLKSKALGVVSGCHPNGKIQKSEECDPLAVPTGCPTNATVEFFCNDECQCVEQNPIP